MAETVKIGVIGGSGLYNMPDIEDITHHDIDTPFGKPSAPVLVGTLRGKRVAFIPRHGGGHAFSPSTVPYRANIFALKALGVRYIIAVNASGSLKEEYAPGHVVIPDQLVDYTKSERNGRSFFGNTGMVAHVSTAEPFAPELRAVMLEAVKKVGGTVHDGGTFITIEGPRFSTKGESHIFRAWGCHLIGMTSSPEAYLAAEAEIAYASMAHITDYDVWHDSGETVTNDMVIETMTKNLSMAQQALAETIAMLDEDAEAAAHNNLAQSLVTARDKMPEQTMRDLAPIVARYLDA